MVASQYDYPVSTSDSEVSLKEMGKSDPYQITTKHSKALTM